MNPRTALVVAALSGCGVESVSSTEQAVGQPGVLERFRMTGEGAAFVGATNGPPWTIQVLTVDRYITDAVPAPVYLQFGGTWQDPTSLYLGPYGYYYAAGYSDYAYGTLSLGDAQLSSNNAQLHATVPANSDTFYSERCYVDFRIGYRECVSLEGQPIDIEWQSTGEIDVVNGLQVIDMGAIALKISGRSSFAIAHATGSLVGMPLQNELSSYITADRGDGAWIEVSSP